MPEDSGNQHPPASDSESSDGLAKKAAALEAENQRLSEQVRRLLAAENKLYVLQDHLNSQQRVYVRLAELGRELNALLDVDKIVETVARFVVYSFNYERCAAFLRDTSDGTSSAHTMATTMTLRRSTLSRRR